MKFLTHNPEESHVNELTSVETSVAVSVLRGGSKGGNGTRGEADREEGEGGGREGDGTPGIEMGEDELWELDGESRGTEDELLAIESKVVWLGLRRGS